MAPYCCSRHKVGWFTPMTIWVVGRYEYPPSSTLKTQELLQPTILQLQHLPRIQSHSILIERFEFERLRGMCIRVLVVLVILI
jgi:hypothetical protein